MRKHPHPHRRLAAQLAAEQKRWQDLPPHIRAVAPRPGRRDCRGCGKPFISPDPDHVRTCPVCRQKAENPPREILLEDLGLPGLDREF